MNKAYLNPKLCPNISYRNKQNSHAGFERLVAQFNKKIKISNLTKEMGMYPH